jgi:hypothetical protein
MIWHGTGRMFPFITCPGWNPLSMRCRHACSYCWAEALKNGKLRHTKKYANLTDDVVIHIKELHRKFKPDDFVFVETMGDLFGAWVPTEWIDLVLGEIQKSPARYLLLTKNPERLGVDFHADIGENCVVGTTVETNRPITSLYSKAPPVKNRLLSMVLLDHPHKMISIEPIIDFDLEIFVPVLKKIRNLEAVAVGYDNYNHGLLEPSLAKTQKLIQELDKFVPMIYVKTLRERIEE